MSWEVDHYNQKMITTTDQVTFAEMFSSLQGSYQRRWSNYPGNTFVFVGLAAIALYVMLEVAFRNNVWGVTDQWQLFLALGAVVAIACSIFVHQQFSTVHFQEHRFGVRSPFAFLSWMWSPNELEEFGFQRDSLSFTTIIVVNKRHQLKVIKCTKLMRERLQPFYNRVYPAYPTT